MPQPESWPVLSTALTLAASLCVSLQGQSSPPDKPSAIGAIAADARVTVIWAATAGATSFHVYRSTTGGDRTSTPIATDVTATRFVDRTAVNGTRYFYQVRAVNGAGLSDWSAEAVATPNRRPPAHILGYRNGSTGAGVNANEIVLTPDTVNVSLFSKRYSTTVDGQIYAQPLYVSGLHVAAGPQPGIHDVVFVATAHNSLYAIDADSGDVLWRRSFIDPERGITTVPAVETSSKDLVPEIGIIATPVIELATQTIFVQAKTKEVRVGEPSPHYVQYLIAVNVSTGEVVRRAVIADTTYEGGSLYRYNSGPYVKGNGLGHIVVNGQPRIYFNALRQLFRPGLLLYEGNIYLAAASHGDNDPYHGWVLSYDAATLTLNGALNTTPNGEMGGIWQSGAVITVDSRGFLYFETGNGSFKPVFNARGFPADGNYGNSFVKIARDRASTAAAPNINGWGLIVVDYFTPFNEEALDLSDSDLGSGAPLILPDSVGSPAHPRLLVGGSKEGKIYLIDRDNMGKHDPKTDRVVQQQASAVGGIFGSPAFFNGHLYFTGSYDGPIRKFSIVNGQLSPRSISQTPDDFGNLDGAPFISANGSDNGILWNLDRGSGQLRAYDANDLSRRLYASNLARNDRDRLGMVQKFSVPIVADGRVFVGGFDALVAYGPPDPPTALPTAPGRLTAIPRLPTQIDLTWEDRATNEDLFIVERSPDGANDWQRVGTAGVNATSFRDSTVRPLSGYVYRVRAQNALGDSAFDSASANTSATLPIGNGDGLLGQYFDDSDFKDLKVRRVDPTINFEFASGSPDPSVSPESFSARWTGQIQAQFSEPYTFYTLSDDGVRLTVNGRVLIDNWTEHSATEDASPPIVLAAATSYSIQLDYFDNLYDSLVTLSWSSPSTPKQVVPTSQLFSGVAPLAPSDLTVEPAAGTQVNLSWLDNSANETGFLIERKTEISGEYQHRELVNPNQRTYIDTALDPGQRNFYRVRATNFGDDSVPSNEVSVVTPTPPRTPSGQRTTSVTTTLIGLAWIDNATDETAYRIFRRGGSTETFVLVATLPPDSTSYTDRGAGDAGLTPGSQYDYHIQAGNLAGFTDFAGMSIRTLTLAPSNVQATVGDRRVMLSWTSPAGADSFTIYRSTKSDASDAVVRRAGLTAPEFTDTDVRNGRTYYYQITAVNSGGESTKSSMVSGRPGR